MKEINPIIIDILKNRGITDREDIEEFLSDKPKKTYDPFLLADLQAGVDFLLSAIKENKKICIYGDYDADGITSVSILYEVLSKLTENMMYYIPSRFTEGYGLNKEALREIKEQGARFVVTVDCGSTSYEEISYAKHIGLELLVTDHHNITRKADDCLMVNPKYEGNQYPFRDLAGCGVAFKLAQGVQRKAGLPKSVLTEVLDLVAIGTVGDIVPLVDENRTLTKYGLAKIKERRRKGLAHLIEKISLNGDNIDSQEIAFGIVPHLNAAGRMADAKLGVELLLSRDEKKIKDTADSIIACNEKRKAVQEKAYEKCINIVEKDLKDKLFLIIEAEDIHEGIAGIVAGKIKDKYKKPTVIVMPSGDLLKGTGRSIGKVDLYETLREFDYLYERFGGHKSACGFSIKKECLQEFKEGVDIKIQEQYAQDNGLFREDLTAEKTISGKDINFKLAKDLECLGPFGCANREPLFLLKDVEITEVCLMGKDNQHMRFKAVCKDHTTADCILFTRAKELEDMLCNKTRLDLIGHIRWQEWRGNIKVQFIVDNML